MRFPKFDKSYARIIDSFIMLDDLYSANQYYEQVSYSSFHNSYNFVQLKNNFTEDTVRKYPEVITKLKEMNDKADEGMKKLMKSSKKVIF